ncbi:MAG: hypothetical protein DMF13_08110 [Verrucomicrobia bacterium]|nr:MAG: hypothetical protein DMF13_08110 [Verrucomicrobiota bacterium]
MYVLLFTMSATRLEPPQWMIFLVDVGVGVVVGVAVGLGVGDGVGDAGETETASEIRQHSRDR